MLSNNTEIYNIVKPRNTAFYTKENDMYHLDQIKKRVNTFVSIALTAPSIVLCCLINSTARFGPIPRKESQ